MLATGLNQHLARSPAGSMRDLPLHTDDRAAPGRRAASARREFPRRAAGRGRAAHSASRRVPTCAIRCTTLISASPFATCTGTRRRWRCATKRCAFKPDYREAPMSIADWRCCQLQRREEAVAAFGAALALNRRFCSRALKISGDTLSELGRFDEAIADFDRLLALTPGDVSTLKLTLIPWARADRVEAHRRGAGELRPRTGAGAGFARDRQQPRHGAPGDGTTRGGADLLYARGAAQPRLCRSGRQPGLALQDVARFDEALASYAEAQRMRPDWAFAALDTRRRCGC